LETGVCDKPTVIERIVNLFPGPYILKCFTFSCIFGVPLLLFTRFLDTWNVRAALEVFGPLLWQNVLTFSFANFVLSFYSVYSVRYMRSRIARVVSNVELSGPNNKTVGKVFAPVCRLIPAVILSVLLFSVTLISLPNQLEHGSGPISFGLVLVSIPFVYLAYGTFVWVYASSVKCLSDLGKQPLKLMEFYEDPHLGMKPLGSLSLSLAAVYFAGLGLVFFSFLSIPLPLELAVIILIVAGLGLFFLPLSVIHHKMKDKKKLESEKLKRHYKELIDSSGNPLQNVVDPKNVKRIIAVEIIERKVASIPEWPFDERTLTSLSAIILTVAASIIARYVLVFLGL
jgi:hypothetical protein